MWKPILVFAGFIGSVVGGLYLYRAVRAKPATTGKSAAPLSLSGIPLLNLLPAGAQAAIGSAVGGTTAGSGLLGALGSVGSGGTKAATTATNTSTTTVTNYTTTSDELDNSAADDDTDDYASDYAADDAADDIDDDTDDIGDDLGDF